MLQKCSLWMQGEGGGGSSKNMSFVPGPPLSQSSSNTKWKHLLSEKDEKCLPPLKGGRTTFVTVQKWHWRMLWLPKDYCLLVIYKQVWQGDHTQCTGEVPLSVCEGTEVPCYSYSCVKEMALWSMLQEETSEAHEEWGNVICPLSAVIRHGN